MDLFENRNSSGESWIDQMWMLGDMELLMDKNIRPFIEHYLKKKANIKKAEQLIANKFRSGIFNDIERIVKIVHREFGVKLKPTMPKVKKQAVQKVKSESKFADFIAESQKLIEQKLDELVDQKKSVCWKFKLFRRES
jgi:hypothetical protein